MTMMIALVGDQPQPNFLPALHYRPDTILLVYTQQKQEKYEYLKIMLEQQRFTIIGLETDPYNITTIVAALKEKIAEIVALTPQPLIFNLTGATKIMSLAAYQVGEQCNASALYMQSEGGQSRVDHYIWQRHQLLYQKQEILPEHLHLRDVLDLQLGQGKERWEAKGPSSDDKNYGHLFELAIAQALRNHGYEVMCGVKGKNNQIDIDVMVRYENQVSIIEAKTSATGSVTNLDAVKQLSTASNYLRGTYINSFLVINGKASKDLAMMCGLLKIPIISLPHYKRGATAFSLSEEDSKTLLTEIDRKMKR
ncbi:Card1-like endonuclease domain-containing protein [Tengunoibacter tsumagoiensis]|uniref:Card1 CARF domain-containing protein n=1 Tax=Tengunoibacter tsumagoiensis TaxID=2014871 RepID=A0A402A803_9CHLR|nr:DUF1887 family CARF protein [Tengunoibacter tsumagoiensis]GCE15111.1 hypothetical protein KTT_49700 [Tengunoibacter tsumagoiensis]